MHASVMTWVISSSAAAPDRCALVAERAHAFLAVLGAERFDQRRQLLRLRFARSEMRGAPRHGLDRADRQRRAREHLPDPAIDGSIELGARDDFVDEAERVSLARRYPASSEQNPHRRAKGNLPGEKRH